MKTHSLGKRENLREVKEAKESEGKQKKVPTEETTKTKTPNDLDLAIAEMVHNRQPYHVIAKKLKVSPRTISAVTKKMTEGAIKIGADGKAMYHENAKTTEIEPLPPELQMEILGAAHLEGKSPHHVIARWVRDDRKMRLKGLNLNQIERTTEFLEKAYTRGWTTDGLVGIITRLENLRLSDLNPQLMVSLREFLEHARSHNLNPEQIVRTSQKTETEWKKHIQEGYNMGIKEGADILASWLLELAPKAFDDKYTLHMLSGIVDIAKKEVMRDLARAAS